MSKALPSDDICAGRKSLVAFGRRMIADGLAVGSAGNLSVRIGDAIAITPSGVAYEDVAETDICLLSLDGLPLDAGPVPSSEVPLHLEIYRSTPAAAVVHSHSPAVVALSTVLDELPAIHYAIVRLGGPVRVVPYGRFGSNLLAESTSAALRDRTGAILQNHGSVTYGRDLSEAYDRALLLEWLATVYAKAVSLGDPRLLSTAELAEVTAEVRRRRFTESSRRSDMPSTERLEDPTP